MYGRHRMRADSVILVLMLDRCDDRISSEITADSGHAPHFSPNLHPKRPPPKIAVESYRIRVWMAVCEHLEIPRGVGSFRLRGVGNRRDRRFYRIGALSSAIHVSARWHHAGFGLNGIGSLSNPLSCARAIAAALRPTGAILP